jgi:hypothetical protein
MGFKTPKANSAPQFTGIQINTASSIRAVPLAGGMVRMGWNLIDYTDFQSHKHKQKAGKGFGGSTTTYTYTATIVGLLCVGEVDGVGQAWKDNGDVADFASLGYTLFTGSIPQAPWGYMAAAHPDHADSYPGFAYLAKANDDLGGSATLSNYNFEVRALFYATAAGGALPDADPALWTNDFLTNDDHGVSQQLVQFIDIDQLLSGPDAATTGDSAYQTYCRAMGFGISPLMSDQEPAASAVERWCLITNTAPVWTGFSFKLVPYGDEPVTGHGVTWLPPTALRFALSDDDYLPGAGADPLVASRSDPSQAKNYVAFNIRDRGNAYNEAPVDAKNDNAIALYGQQDADSVTAREICSPAMGKVMVALYAQRILFTRNGYEFTVGPQFDLIEPMDCGTVSDPELGLAIPVRITEIQEGEDNSLNMLAEQFDGTLGSPGATSASSVTPTDINSLVAPGPVNPPIIFEPPASLAQRLFGSAAPCVAAAVSGGDGATVNPNWGGCIVWVSTDDATYQAIGEIDGPARMGVTTTALAAYGGANPDTVHVLGVSLLESGGDLANAATSADAAAGATLSVLQDADGSLEYFAYKLATLTGLDAYDLGAELYRGQYGSVAAAHLNGVAFARLDSNLFKFDIPQAYVGQDLWFKFQSFNIWGNALEDLAGCTAYGPFTPSGAGFGGGLGGVPDRAHGPDRHQRDPGRHAAVERQSRRRQRHRLPGVARHGPGPDLRRRSARPDGRRPDLHGHRPLGQPGLHLLPEGRERGRRRRRHRRRGRHDVGPHLWRRGQRRGQGV